MNLTKKIVCLTAAVCILGGSTQTFADTITNEINKTQEKKKELQQVLDSKKNEKESVENQINAIFLDIEKTENSIKEKQVHIAEVEQEILKLEEEIKEKEKELETQKGGIKNTLQVLSSKGEVQFLEFLFRSDNLSQFISRATQIKDIYSKNKEMYDDVLQKLEYIEKQTEIVVKKGEALQKEVEVLEQMNSELNTKREQAVALMNKIESSINEINNGIAVQNKKYQELLQKKQRLAQVPAPRTGAPTTTATTTNAPTVNGSGVVELAVNWAKSRGLGSSNPVIYSMGLRGTDMQLNRYGDCSSFTRRVFLDAGKGDIGWTTAQQVTNRSGYFFDDLSQLQPGDLMYFGPTSAHRYGVTLPNGKRSAVSHVAIYIGNGQMIDNSSSIGTISIKNFGPGGRQQGYVNNNFIGAVRF